MIFLCIKVFIMIVQEIFSPEVCLCVYVTGSMSALILITVHVHVIGCDLTCNVSFKVLYACITSLVNKFYPISCKNWLLMFVTESLG